MTDSGDHRDTRREYATASLSRAQLTADPLELFTRWMKAVRDEKDATAMALATADAQGAPSVRVVLLKQFDASGFVFYTDYRSQKGTDLAVNPRASGLFYWRDFDRQVRISGAVSRVDVETSRSYFESRPAESRFSAAASNQSAVVADRAALEAEVVRLQSRYPDESVPMPAEWGGFRLVPEEFEFWQGREGRLHDRFRYRRTASGWQVDRLQP